MELNMFVEKFASQFEDTEFEDITSECQFHDLDEWSSIMGLTMLAFIQKEMGKVILAEEMRRCRTVKDLWTLVETK